MYSIIIAHCDITSNVAEFCAYCIGFKQATTQVVIMLGKICALVFSVVSKPRYSLL